MIDTDHPEFTEFEGETLGDTLTNLITEIMRLRKLQAAVVGSWMMSCDHSGPWHKALRYPCVELGYLTLNGFYYELSEEYQDMAKEWMKEKYGDERK